jgi:hypothetical protein
MHHDGRPSSVSARKASPKQNSDSLLSTYMSHVTRILQLDYEYLEHVV